MELPASKPPIIDDFIAFIREANELLGQESDLSPANRAVTGIMEQLSLRLRTHYGSEEIQAVLADGYIQRNLSRLRDRLSEVEFLTELADSRRLCKSEDFVLEQLTRLPVWSIYMALVSEELSILRHFIQRSDQTAKLTIVFVGGGPLPLSPIIMHLLGDMDMICLELDSVAYEASRSLLERLGLSNKVTVVLENGSHFDYSSFSRIFVASLVKNKQAVLEQISRTASAPLVAVRTAEGIKQLMYEAIDESQLNNRGWRVLGRTRPDGNLVINSTLFLDRAMARVLSD